MRREETMLHSCNIAPLFCQKAPLHVIISELSYIFTSNLIHNMAQCYINNITPGNASQYFTRHWANTDDWED